MRILAVSNLYPPDVMGGYEIACRQAVDALIARGHDVRVLTAAPRSATSDEPHVLRRLKLTDDRYWVALDDSADDLPMLLRDVESRFISAHNVQTLLATLEAFRPDVLYLNNLVGLGGLGLVATLQYLGVPWVWQLGDSVPSDLCFARRDHVPELAREFVRAVQGRFVAVSDQLVEEIEGHGVTLRGRVRVEPYWITGERPEPRTGVRSPGPLRILSTGRVNRQKGVDILIEAAGLLRDAGRTAFVVDVYGEVADATIGPLIRSLGLEDVVHLKGPRRHGEILALYGEYDVFAFPTREREPFGIVPLEALSRGCVPIVTRRCGVAEWLVHGVHCLKAGRSAGAFAEAMGRVMDGEFDLPRMARAGEAAVWRDFHIDVVIPRIEEELESAARERVESHTRPVDASRLARLAEELARTFAARAFAS